MGANVYRDTYEKEDANSYAINCMFKNFDIHFHPFLLCKSINCLFLFLSFSLSSSLPCSCSQGDVVTHTAWLNRSSILYTGEDKWSVDPRVSLVTLNRDEFTIKIENINLSDEGLYVCAIQTKSKPRTTSVHIIVQGELEYQQHVHPLERGALGFVQSYTVLIHY